MRGRGGVAEAAIWLKLGRAGGGPPCCEGIGAGAVAVAGAGAGATAGPGGGGGLDIVTVVLLAGGVEAAVGCCCAGTGAGCEGGEPVCAGAGVAADAFDAGGVPLPAGFIAFEVIDRNTPAVLPNG